MQMLRPVHKPSAGFVFVQNEEKLTDEIFKLVYCQYVSIRISRINHWAVKSSHIRLTRVAFIDSQKYLNTDYHILFYIFTIVFIRHVKILSFL